MVLFLVSLLLVPLLNNARVAAIDSNELTVDKINQAIEAAQASLSVTYNRFQVRKTSASQGEPSSIVR
jgi:hypothetical protein